MAPPTVVVDGSIWKVYPTGRITVCGIDHVVTVEHRPRFSAAQLHDRPFVDRGAPKVARRGAA